VKGTMLIYKPGVADPERKDFDHMPPYRSSSRPWVDTSRRSPVSMSSV
jgi:hypothetical protein